MKVTELIDYLEQVEEEHGDVDVRATCDGWCPPEIEVEWHVPTERVVLSGVRRVGNSSHHHGEIEVLNE